jgi:hypothetical protein
VLEVDGFNQESRWILSPEPLSANSASILSSARSLSVSNLRLFDTEKPVWIKIWKKKIKESYVSTDDREAQRISPFELLIISNSTHARTDKLREKLFNYLNNNWIVVPIVAEKPNSRNNAEKEQLNLIIAVYDGRAENVQQTGWKDNISELDAEHTADNGETIASRRQSYDKSGLTKCGGKEKNKRNEIQVSTELDVWTDRCLDEHWETV